MQEEQTKQKNSSGLKLLLVLLMAAIWIVALLMIALINLPKSPVIPEFEIKDKNGLWEAQGTVAVFNENIKPGDEGEYYFVISNVSDGNLKYSFDMKEHYPGNKEWIPFMQYRIKMNGKLIEGEDWYMADELCYDEIIILPKTKQLMTLEWRWAFENGKDENDTLIGNRGGEFVLYFHVTAKLAE